KKPPRTRSQDNRQWIVDLVGMTKRDNVASLVHGVSLSLRGSGRLDTRLDTPPISFRHHPVSRIARALVHHGPPEVVDADLAYYFGSIPHAELLNSVARRIVDRRVLQLIKLWLECAVEETD